MTTHKPIQGSYDASYDPRPKTVTIGVSLVTVEEHTFEQDGRTVTCPVDDEITYISVPREIVFLPCGGASYEIVADILDTRGYRKSVWKIMSIWTPEPNYIADEIF